MTCDQSLSSIAYVRPSFRSFTPNFAAVCIINSILLRSKYLGRRGLEEDSWGNSLSQRAGCMWRRKTRCWYVYPRSLIHNKKVGLQLFAELIALARKFRISSICHTHGHLPHLHAPNRAMQVLPAFNSLLTLAPTRQCLSSSFYISTPKNVFHEPNDIRT